MLGRVATMNGHLSGGKFTASHTTVIDAASGLARAVSRLECVSKISLGMIQTLKNGPPHVKMTEISPGCLLIKVRGSRAIQELRVYASDLSAVSRMISSEFGGR